MKRNAPRLKMPVPVQLPSGSWRCQVRVGGQTHSITDADPDACAARAYALKMGLIRERKKPADLTLRQAAEDLIARLEGRRSPATVDGYRKILRTDFASILDRPLSRLTPGMLDEAVREMCARPGRNGKPLSPKTAKNNWSFIAEVLRKYAPDLQLNGVILPEVKNAVTVVADEERILRAVVGTPVELPCLLAAWLSLSMSEIKGLTKSKSLRGDYLIVGEETVVYVAGEEIRKTGGKEATRSRAVRLPAYLHWLIDDVPGDVIVPATARSITARYRRILARAGVPYLKFHGLRHLNASVMGELMIDRATARERGGWKSDAIMERVYTHALSGARDRAEERLDGYFLRVIHGSDPETDKNPEKRPGEKKKRGQVAR